jgi:hypothetical protein
MRPALLIFALLAPVALAACGGGGSRAASTTAATGATTVAPASGPQAQLLLAEAAMRRVKSFHLDGTESGPDGSLVLSGDITAQGSARIRMTQDGATARVVIVGRSLYMRADRAFWQGHQAPAAIAEKIAGLWVKAPPDKGIDRLAKSLLPQTIAHCLGYQIGPLRSAGTGTYRGHPVRILRSAGGMPGTQPGRLYIAAQGRPLPLRGLQTGPIQPGGKLDPRCDDPSSPNNDTRSDVRLSRFDVPVHIAVPRRFLDLERLIQQQSGTTAS